MPPSDPAATAPSPASSAAAAAPAPPAPRLVSLDAFRGFTMFWIVGGKSLLVALGALQAGAVVTFIRYQLTHSPWEGLRFYDLIWPSFMLMVGVSVPFSRIIGIFSKPIAAGLGGWGPLFSAAAVLLVEWLVLYWMYQRKIFLRA